ncbi:MAG: ribosome-recycling factor [Mycoplasmoidaceae bacterium]|nr:ribosome-recycling factor [Mycoplasmoidaceae bacterium]
MNSERVNPNMFNQLKVPAYGEMTPLMQLANVQAVDARQLVIKPYDRSLVKDIAKALAESEYKVNPQVNPDCIRIIFAPLTEEIRKEAAKKAKEYYNQAVQKLRSVRQDVQAKYKKAPDVSDDDIRYYEDQLNKITKEANKKLEEQFARKEKDLMSL